MNLLFEIRCLCRCATAKCACSWLQFSRLQLELSLFDREVPDFFDGSIGMKVTLNKSGE